MSLQTFIQTVETDLSSAVHWVEGEVDSAFTDIWNTVKPIFINFEPTLVQGVLGGIVAFLGTLSDLKGGTLADIETALLNDLEAAGSTLFADAQTLGSDIVQALIGLAKAV